MKTEKHILFVLPAYKEGRPDEFFNYAICQVNQAEALASIGYRVSVLSRFNQNHELTRNGVDYIFLDDGKPFILKRWQVSKTLVNRITEMNVDLVHFHGFIFPSLLDAIIKDIASTTKIVAEYHSDPIFSLMKRQQKRVLSKTDRLIFANGGAKDIWTEKMGFPKEHSSLSIECAPDLKLMDKLEARSISGFTGSPVFLWNSRLISRRDPITVIEGYRQFLQENDYPDSHFYWMIPDGEEGLLDALKNRVAKSSVLSNAVTIIEKRLPHDQLGPYFSSADYIISGSLDDGYGYGVADAMSCGAVPICTDISTFRQITNDGEFGGLWEPGNQQSLAQKMSELVRDTYGHIDELSSDVMQYFNHNLSRARQADQLDKIYQEVWNRQENN